MHPPAPEKLNYAPKSSMKFVKIKLYQRHCAEGTAHCKADCFISPIQFLHPQFIYNIHDSVFNYCSRSHRRNFSRWKYMMLKNKTLKKFNVYIFAFKHNNFNNILCYTLFQFNIVVIPILNNIVCVKL